MQSHIHHARCDDIDFSGIPNIIKPILTIRYLPSCQNRIAASQAIGDHEGARDARFKFCQLPVMLLGSVSGTVALLDNFALAWPAIRVALKASIVLGLIACVGDWIYESWWVKRMKEFLEIPEMQILRGIDKQPTFEKAKELFDKHQEYLKKMLPKEKLDQTRYHFETAPHLTGYWQKGAQDNAIAGITALALGCLQKKYFNENDVGKQVELARRIRPWCYVEIEKQLQPAIRALESYFPDTRLEGMKSAGKIFNAMQTQADKKLLYHRLSQVMIVLTVAMLLASLAACPWFVPLILLGASYLLIGGQYGFYYFVLDNKGWELDLSPITAQLPALLRNRSSEDFRPKEADQLVDRSRERERERDLCVRV